MPSLPKKLKHDAILEADFELRFESASMSVPEVFFGRLADDVEWKGYLPRRLPMADIPAAIRRVDPNLKFQASIELIDAVHGRSVKIGPHNLVYTARAPYPGWSEYGPAVLHAIDALFGAVPDVTVTRLGLRYVNAFQADAHGIDGIDKLNIVLKVGELSLSQNLNLNYTAEVGADSACTVRIATRDFVQGPLPESACILADFDVFTKEPYENRDVAKIKAWTEFAHEEEKKLFFGMLTEDTINRLREE